MPRPVERRHRSGAEADPRFGAQAFEDRGRDAARPCRPQGIEPQAVGWRAADPARRGRLADGGAVRAAAQGGRSWHRSRSMPQGSSAIRDAFVAAAKRAERLGIDASNCTARTAICCISSCRRSPTSAPTNMAAPCKTGMRYPLEVFDAVRAVFPIEQAGRRQGLRDRLGRGRLGPRADHRICAGN